MLFASMVLLSLSFCKPIHTPPFSSGTITPGAYQMSAYIDKLKGKKIAVVANQTSTLNRTHLIDTLLNQGIEVVKIFAPEHGFRGEGDAGEKIENGIDKKTRLPIISLYGSHKKPTAKDLQAIDVVVFDIQDVGVRFYTYLSTLHYVMEACAENNIPLILLDRPNPNGHYIDGPVLKPVFKSFVGLHPVPIVYGMTIGEYAKMINGEGWLKDSVHCQLTVISILNYTHNDSYSIEIPPSPNLRTDLAIYLYPSLCLFEATTISVGRGTSRPFEIFGHPKFPKGEFQFTPISKPGSKNPLHQNKICYGVDLKKNVSGKPNEINLEYLIRARDLLADSAIFVNQNEFFNLLAGNADLRIQLMNGWTSEQIKNSWKVDLDAFKKIRQKYLIYR